MEFEFLDHISIWFIIAFILAGAVLVWISGSKLSHYAGIIAERTGLGQAVIGALLLGGITSLPEMATTVTASLIGSAPIAVNNILGGVSMQVAVLAVADFFARRTALSYHLDNPEVKIQALFNIFLLAIVLTGILFSGMFGGIPVWTGFIFLVYMGSFFIMKSVGTEQIKDTDQKHEKEELSNFRLSVYTITASVVILLAGFIISVSGENIAGRTNLGENLVGAVLIAATTSLPELSTTISAVKEKKYKLAASNIFGSNMIMLALLFIADLTYRGSVLEKAEDFSQFGALSGILLTTIFLFGINARKNKTFLNAGVDSWLVLILYLAALVVLYMIR